MKLGLMCRRPAPKYRLLKAVAATGAVLLLLQNMPQLVRYLRMERM